LYKALYDEKHRYLVVPLSDIEQDDVKQKGLREPLLCAACEQQVGRNEQYASNLLFHRPLTPARRTQRTIVVDGVDYARFKLFLLSLLWRAHCSSLDGFRQVRLGPHAETLRQRLLRGEPGATADYPCIITALPIHRSFFKESIIPPYRLRLGTDRAYRMAFAGFVFTFLVSTRLHRHDWKDVVIDSSGSLPLHLTTPQATERYLRSLTS
jgi:hypothetical protein